MLKVSGLYKHFGDLVVLENFNFTVFRRGFTILIGPSGCGKSTLFNILTGVLPREGGDIYWLEKSLPHLGKNELMPKNPQSSPSSGRTNRVANSIPSTCLVFMNLSRGVDCLFLFFRLVVFSHRKTSEIGPIAH